MLSAFDTTAARLGTTSQNVEMDFWVCWTLDALFNGFADGGPRLLFKGGTSLRAIAGIMAAIEECLSQPFMKARVDELERQRAEIADRLAQAPPDVPAIHPNVSNIYRQNVVRFTEALDDPDGGREAAQALRSLIGQIVLTPGKSRGEVHAELHGELMGIFEFGKPKQNQRPSRWVPAVAAGPRNQFGQKPQQLRELLGLLSWHRVISQ